MTWKEEHKDIMRKYYSGYCTMCRKLEIEPVPYHKFTIELYDETKLKLNTK